MYINFAFFIATLQHTMCFTVVIYNFIDKKNTYILNNSGYYKNYNIIIHL